MNFTVFFRGRFNFLYKAHKSRSNQLWHGFCYVRETDITQTDECHNQKEDDMLLITMLSMLFACGEKEEDSGEISMTERISSEQA
jgi:hypothetical protein